MRYIFGVENFSGEKSEVAVVSESYDCAVEKLHNYSISKGELHYYWLIKTDDEITEIPYNNTKARKAACFMVALAGAYLGTSHLNSENIVRNAIDGIKDKTTQRLITEGK